MATYWEIAAHSAYNMFSNCQFSFLKKLQKPKWEYLSDCALMIIAFLYLFIPSFVKMRPPVLEKKIFVHFEHL